MASDFNFMPQIAQQLPSGTSYKSVSGPAGSKPPGGATGEAGALNSDTNFKSALQKASDNNTSSTASNPPNNQHPYADEDGLQTDGFSEVATDNVAQADNLIGDNRHHRAAGDAPVGEQDAALLKIQLLELLKKLGCENLSLAENGNLLSATANGELVSLAPAGGDEVPLNAAARQVILEKLEALLKQFQNNDAIKSTAEMHRLMDVFRGVASADGVADSKTGEIAKLVQQLIAKPDTALVEGNIQHNGLRNHVAAMIGTEKAAMAEVAKTSTSDGSAQRVQADTLKPVARADVSTIQSQSNDGRPVSQANALNDLIQDALAGQKNAQEAPPKKGADSGMNPADSNPFSNPSTPKTETNLQTVKTVGLKSEATAAIEVGARIVNPDAAKAEGFSFSQHQSELKTLDGQQFAKELESIPKYVRSQTLDQIVQKAVLHFKNGQNEVQLNLKPDFLGQIRMQIITESQQVTVRILTEYPMVKELIENNIQQLKSGLQQYGLEIDELEVSVAHDSEQHVADRRKASGSKLQNPSEDGDTDEKTGSANTAASALQTTSNAENTIDFFA